MLGGAFEGRENKGLPVNKKPSWKMCVVDFVRPLVCWQMLNNKLSNKQNWWMYKSIHMLLLKKITFIAIKRGWQAFSEKDR